ncbi:hypothetical protein SPRG_14223 [Saprolegnia parasitica CBS 223.65]|uniref:DJ-1/PfpI domain-containing protein n=1 Tax=Saprolegnia parasitica (strain CBS 223.65) TaxID=695850 RepID=A0A067BTC1_SAPPC|nr:hypothetical protein SPRG_14223 [Saprolegnia parasitica CBS 223.65]KDO20075.1 hypothetical protein SPRG_14223 [Saprolegnia parasitica CBS 223.65]|eukprot:XP_012209235.1 hypothetical protein SPRG_14223 [Saprolegnia parasitica CBS 223.65]
MATHGKLVVGILVFPGFATLDIAGPLQFFEQLEDGIETILIAREAGTLYSRPPTGGCPIVASYSFASAPALDVLLVPGGKGCRSLFHDAAYQDFIKHHSSRAQYVLSVCTGSGFLAACGLLDGKRATTNKVAFREIQVLGDGRVQWVKHARWVVDGNVWTSSGVTAGMDMVCAFLTSLFGPERLQRILNVIEYTPATDSGNDPFAVLAES